MGKPFIFHLLAAVKHFHLTICVYKYLVAVTICVRNSLVNLVKFVYACTNKIKMVPFCPCYSHANVTCTCKFSFLPTYRKATQIPMYSLFTDMTTPWDPQCAYAILLKQTPITLNKQFVQTGCGSITFKPQSLHCCSSALMRGFNLQTGTKVTRPGGSQLSLKQFALLFASQVALFCVQLDFCLKKNPLYILGNKSSSKPLCLNFINASSM